MKGWGTMTLSWWARCRLTGALLAAAGCATSASAPSSPVHDAGGDLVRGLPARHISRAPAEPDLLARRISRAPAEPDVLARRELVTAVPLELPVPMAGLFTRTGRGVGYYWIGYTAANVGAGELRDAGAGDGFSFGLGLKFSESSRAFFEVAFEKSVNHSYPTPTNPPANPVFFQTGSHERLLIGGRSIATPRVRMTQKHPRPYLSYGLSTSSFRVERVAAAGGDYTTGALGLYAGLGTELPFGESASFSFDIKYHVWNDTDSTGTEGMFATVAFAILGLARF